VRNPYALCRQGSFRFGFNNQHLYSKSGITLPGAGEVIQNGLSLARLSLLYPYHSLSDSDYAMGALSCLAGQPVSVSLSEELESVHVYMTRSRFLLKMCIAVTVNLEPDFQKILGKILSLA